MSAHLWIVDERYDEVTQWLELSQLSSCISAETSISSSAAPLPAFWCDSMELLLQLAAFLLPKEAR